jgi:hypothetical protein
MDHSPGNNDFLIITKLFPSSDDRDGNFSGVPPKARAEIMINQTTQ